MLDIEVSILHEANKVITVNHHYHEKTTSSNVTHKCSMADATSVQSGLIQTGPKVGIQYTVRNYCILYTYFRPTLYFYTDLCIACELFRDFNAYKLPRT